MIRRAAISALRIYDILKPDSFLYEDESDHTLDQVCQLDTGKYHNHREGCKMTQAVGDRNTYQTDKGTVEQEGDDCLAAGAQREVGSMQESILRHKTGCNHDEIPGKEPGIVGGVVEQRKQGRCQKHDSSHSGTTEHGEGDHLTVSILGFVHLAGTEKLSDYDSYGITKGDKDYIEHIVDRVGNILGGHYIKPADRITLCQNCHTTSPQGLVDQKRCSLDQNFLQQNTGNLQGTVKSCCKRMFCSMPVCVDYDNCHLHVAGEDGCNGSTLNTKDREAEFAIDQEVVEYQVDAYSHDTRFHRHDGVSTFPQGAGINLHYHERRQADQHDPQILFAIGKRCCNALSVALALEVQSDQRFTPAQEQKDRKDGDDGYHPYLVAHGLTDTLMILLTEILCGEDTGPGHSAKQAEIVYKKKLIDDGDAGHLLRSDPSDHDVVKQADKVGDTVLDHDRNGNGKNHFIKGFIAEIFLPDTVVLYCFLHKKLRFYYTFSVFLLYDDHLCSGRRMSIISHSDDYGRGNFISDRLSLFYLNLVSFFT